MDPFLVAGGLSSMGNLLGGVTNYFSEMAQAKQDENNGLVTSENAGINSSIQLQQGNAVAAEAATRAAANGGGLVGSSMGIITNLATQAMYNARQTIYRGAVTNQQALYEAKVARANAILGLVGGGIKAATSMVGGWANQQLESKQMGIALADRGLGSTSAAGYAGFSIGGDGYYGSKF